MCSSTPTPSLSSSTRRFCHRILVVRPRARRLPKIAPLACCRCPLDDVEFKNHRQQSQVPPMRPLLPSRRGGSSCSSGGAAIVLTLTTTVVMMVITTSLSSVRVGVVRAFRPPSSSSSFRHHVGQRHHRGFWGPPDGASSRPSPLAFRRSVVRDNRQVLAPTALSLSSTSSTSDDDTNNAWTTDRVRSTFINYFQNSKNHEFVPSSPCVPLNDPTLLFANAGMNQFKPIFLGQVDPNSFMSQLQRAVNSQKCIRAGGKHNDLDDVGRDTYHHTFFEMLGTWSFGNYFKREAIKYAWELLTDVYQLDPNRLYATYFEGNDNVPQDTEARDFWLQYLPAERVIGCNAKDNFWEMGETGPCGPCTEIHYDRIGNRDAASLVNADDPNVIEIWNVVFIQYNREVDGTLRELPAQHVDTGMGLERLTSILQNKSSNYDIDCFQSIFRAIEAYSAVGPYGGRLGTDDTNLKDTAYRAIADHARTLSFAIADGAIPSNEGRGYVLRRILRRAARYGQQILGAPSGFFSSLVPVVVEEFGKFYPELREAQPTIVEVIQEEEASFSSMLDRGIKFFEEMEQDIKGAGQTQVSGQQAFYLYDTLGFPLDLTELMALEAGMTVDTVGFDGEMKAQKDRSRAAQRAARAAGGVALELQAEQTAWLADQGIRPTDDTFKYLSYEWNVELPVNIVAIFGDNGFLKEEQAAEEGEFVGIIMEQSPFYPESGGQVADTGTMVILDDDQTTIGEFTVTDVQVYAGYILHTGFVESGRFPVGATVTCKVDYERRRRIAPNHSMTHVLNAALRKVLGDKVDQRGSLCNDEKLRFDFSHKQALTTQQLKEVEAFCQQVVQEQLNVTSQTLPLEEAKAIKGVRAVFGEVYPDPVRVVSVGNDTSVEFCGGTHIANTKEAEAFALIEETAVAKGIRRITAVTKEAAQKALEEGERFERLVSSKEELDASEVLDLDKQAGAIRKDLDAAFMSASVKAELQARIEVLQKKAAEAKKKLVQSRVDTALNDIRRDIEAAASSKKQSLVLSVDIRADAKASQRVMNTVKELAPNMAFLGVTEEEPGSGGKVMAFALVPDALVAGGLKADEWVKVALEGCGGRGGGKPGSAQGQAKECADVEAVVTAAESFAESKLQTQVA